MNDKLICPSCWSDVTEELLDEIPSIRSPDMAMAYLSTCTECGVAFCVEVRATLRTRSITDGDHAAAARPAPTVQQEK